MKRKWTYAMIEDLKKSYGNTDTSVLAVRYGTSKEAVKGKANKIGLKKIDYHHHWTDENIAQLTQLFSSHTTAEIAQIMHLSCCRINYKAYALGLYKSEAFKSEVKRRLIQNPNHAARNYCFKKGQTPPNKGKKQTEYMSAEAINRTKATRFNKGNLPPNTKQDFEITKRFDKKYGRDYLFIRIALGKWISYHHYVWEQAHGKIPAGVNIQFKDGNPLNCAIDNLYAIPRKRQMLENSGTVKLPDSMIAFYLSGKRGKDKAEIEALKQYPELLDIKRKQILLNRKINKKNENKN